MEIGEEFCLGLMLIKMKRRREKIRKKNLHIKVVPTVRTGKTNKCKYLIDGWFVENSQ